MRSFKKAMGKVLLVKYLKRVLSQLYAVFNSNVYCGYQWARFVWD